MEGTLKEIILDFHEDPMPKLIPRQIEIPVLPEGIRKAIVFIGMRRTGKTYLMYQHMEKMLSQGLDKTKLLYINFEDDRLAGFKIEHFQLILDVYFRLYPEHTQGKELIFYFDEIQVIDGWEKFIRRLLDKEQMKIVISGSSSKLLSKELATSLRGRCFEKEVYPLSFKEYLACQSISVKTHPTKKQLAFVYHYCEEYLKRGGFPETLDLIGSVYRNTIQSYVNTTVFRDVVERYQVKNIQFLKRFLLYCLQNVSALLSVTKVHKTLHSLGESGNRQLLYDYLGYFEEAFLLFRVPIYSHSTRKRQINPVKIYCIDPGVISAYTIKPEREAGVQLENAVYLALRQKGYEEIFYYKTPSGKEVDFLAQNIKGEVHLYQVCLNLDDAKTRAREIEALTEAALEIGLKQAVIITLQHEETIDVEGVHIKLESYATWVL